MRCAIRWVFFVALSIPATFQADDMTTETSPYPPTTSRNLYLVHVGSPGDAGILNGAGIDALLPVSDGYLILADARRAEMLNASGIEPRLIAPDIDRTRLALDTDPDKADTDRFPAVYEDGDLRLVRVDPAEISGGTLGLAPIRTRHLKIVYRDPNTAGPILKSGMSDINLDSLIALVSQDSLESYSYALQALPNRPSGSQGTRMCENWLVTKFAEFGYDSIVVDTFSDFSWWGDPITGHNVTAYKPGAVYPLDYIVIGAHRDAVPGSPGADDNGSGVAAVMEFARIMKDVDTKETIIFALFDAEEDGLLGSWYWANAAAEREDRITFMLNMDMIAYQYNVTFARLYYGNDNSYAQLWAQLADTLAGVNLTGVLSGNSGGSDHLPFTANGYSAVFVHEYIFSAVYHSPRDSTTYMSFDYFTRMAMASLGTVCYVDANVIPQPTLIITETSDFPTIIYPDSPAVVSVHIYEYAGATIVPGGVSLSYRINGGPMSAIPMNDVGGGYYEVELPELECLDRIDYLVTAGEQQTGALITHPGFDEPARAIKATALLVAFDDNFETDQGWTVSGNAASGQWERWRASANFAQPKSDYDGSGKCYLTDHDYGIDVDDGHAILTSPAIDISHSEASLEYARWYANDLGASAYQDIFRIFLYHGDVKHQLDTAGPVASYEDGWKFRQYRINDLFTPADPIRLSFDVSDLGYDSEVEAAVDAVRILAYTERPYIVNETCPDGTVGESYSCLLEATVCAGPIQWSDRYGDLNGSGLALSADGNITGIPSDTGVITFTALATDGIGVTNEKEYAIHTWLPFLCGDADRDGIVNISDVVHIVNYIFKGGPEPYPPEIADVNADGAVNVGDAVALVNYIFKGGDPPICP